MPCLISRPSYVNPFQFSFSWNTLFQTRLIFRPSSYFCFSWHSLEKLHIWNLFWLFQIGGAAPNPELIDLDTRAKLPLLSLARCNNTPTKLSKQTKKAMEQNKQSNDQKRLTRTQEKLPILSLANTTRKTSKQNKQTKQTVRQTKATNKQLTWTPRQNYHCFLRQVKLFRWQSGVSILHYLGRNLPRKNSYF